MSHQKHPSHFIRESTSDAALSMPSIHINAPFVALDGPGTLRHENALAVEKTEWGYRVGLAIVNPAAVPHYSTLFNRKLTSREEWEEVRKSTYSDPIDLGSQFGFIETEPTPALVASVELSGSDLSVVACRLSLVEDMRVSYRHFEQLTELARVQQPECPVDTSLVAAASLGFALYMQRRARGDVVFADIRHGLLLQPDGSWNKFDSQDLLGHIATQEITCKVLASVASLASSRNIPLIYQGCSEVNPDLSHLLRAQLQKNTIRSRYDIDQHLIDKYGIRQRLLHRREYSPTPIPHAGLHLPAYFRMSAPLRNFTDYINLQQIVRIISKEAPLYDHNDVRTFISQVSEHEKERVRRKGGGKYSPLVAVGCETLSACGSLPLPELRSFIADCLDGGQLPAELLQYLQREIQVTPESHLPLLSSLIFSKFIGKSEELRTLAGWIVRERPELIEGLVQSAIESKKLSKQASSSEELDMGGVAESIWCFDHRIYTSLRFTPKPQPFDRDRERDLVHRWQFAKLCGEPYNGDTLSTTHSTLFPNVLRLREKRGPGRKRFTLRYNASQAGPDEVTCSLVAIANKGLEEEIRHEATRSGSHWLKALEDAAADILAKL